MSVHAQVADEMRARGFTGVTLDIAVVEAMPAALVVALDDQHRGSVVLH